MMPKRIQMSRQQPWRADNPDAVIVARPSKYGNPFAIGVRVPVWWITDEGKIRHGNIEAETDWEAVAYFRDWMNGVVECDCKRPPLAGVADHDVACWCKIDRPCHGDVLLELANGGAS